MFINTLLSVSGIRPVDSRHGGDLYLSNHMTSSSCYGVSKQCLLHQCRRHAGGVGLKTGIGNEEMEIGNEKLHFHW